MLPGMEQALETPVVRVRGDVVTAASDRVAIERPLQIRVSVGGDVAFVGHGVIEVLP